MKWKFGKRDQQMAMKQGWFLDTNDLRVVADDGYGQPGERFKDVVTAASNDDAAVAYVVGRAEAGDERAVRALTIMWEEGSADGRAVMLGWQPARAKGKRSTK